jgi:sugar O-acyltransferase (sialic acid O-acetyltransferase NeuD family)
LPVRPLQGWVHAAVGDASIRQYLLEQSGLPAEFWLTIIHPHACIASSAFLGVGTAVAAQAVIGPCARLDTGVIINHAAIVDHDCYVGAYSHIAPGASLAGGVHVGAGVLIGAGARILPEVRIGDGVVIGAGAVVLSDIPAGQTWAGVPASMTNKKIK